MPRRSQGASAPQTDSSAEFLILIPQKSSLSLLFMCLVEEAEAFLKDGELVITEI